MQSSQLVNGNYDRNKVFNTAGQSWEYANRDDLWCVYKFESLFMQFAQAMLWCFNDYEFSDCFDWASN